MIRIPHLKTVYFIIDQQDGLLLGNYYARKEHADGECADRNLRTPNIQGPGKKLMPRYRVEPFRWSPPKRKKP